MSWTANRRPKCDGWCDDASAPVTHVDEKGFIYCAACGPRRRLSGHRCRKMTPAELRHVRAGEVIPHGYYGPSADRSNPGFVRNASGMVRYYCSKCERHFYRTGGRLEANCFDCGKTCKAERRNPTKVAKEGRAAWGYRICSRCQGYGWDRMNRPCKSCGGSGQVHKGVMKHGRRPNPSHPDCPGVSASHQHYQGKCSTDWNWGVGASSAIAIKTWPKHGAVAMVRPSWTAGLWDWEVKVHGKVVADGNAKSSNHAKKWCANTVGRMFGRSRTNPAVGAWVSRVGDSPVSVRAGDRIEYYTSEPGGRLRKKQGTVVPYLVFDDHVMTNGSNNGDYVDDRNFIRVVRKAARRNPILSVISNPLLSIASNPNHHRRSKRTKARFASRTTPLCKACVRQSTSGGVEPLDSSLRAARPKERCGAWDCVRRPRPTQR